MRLLRRPCLISQHVVEMKSRRQSRGFRGRSAYLSVWREESRPVDLALCVLGREGCPSERGVVQSGKDERVDGLQQLELWLRDVGTSLFSSSYMASSCRYSPFLLLFLLLLFPIFLARKINVSGVLVLGFIARASTLKIETACFSETWACAGESMQRHNPEEHNPHCRKNVVSNIIKNARWSY